VKAIKSDSNSDSDEQKRSPGFSGKNRGVTPSVADPGVTHPSDATGLNYANETEEHVTFSMNFTHGFTNNALGIRQ